MMVMLENSTGERKKEKDDLCMGNAKEQRSMKFDRSHLPDPMPITNCPKAKTKNDVAEE